MFNPDRLSLARRCRGMTKRELAELIGVDPRNVTSYESGNQVPSKSTLARLEKELRFPRAFFFLDDPLEPPVDHVSFRALKRMTAKQRHAAIATSALAIALCHWVERRFTLPQPSVVDFSELAPEAAAEGLRVTAGLGQRPVGNMVHFLESLGVRVFSLVQDCHEVDAFSFWQGETPFVLLNTRKSPERSRYDAAHELGHLVLHQHGSPTGREAEEQANAFASAFLMPRANVLAHSFRHPSLATILEQKQMWGTSAMAFAHRLHGLGLLSDWSYRQLCIRMASLGYRRTEPNSRPRETSKLLKIVFGQLRESGISRGQVAKDLAIYPADMNKLVFGLIMTSVEGGGGKGHRSGDLRLVPELNS